MATNGSDAQSAQDIEEYQSKWRELSEALAEQQKEQAKLDGLNEKVTRLDAKLDATRETAFNAVRNFAPEGSLRGQAQGLAPDGATAPIDLLVKQSGIKDSYYTEAVDGRDAASFRKAAIGNVRQGLGRAAYEPGENGPAAYPMMGSVDDLNNSPLHKADGFVASRMELRQENEMAAAAKAGPEASTRAQQAHLVESQLFNYRREDERARQDHLDRNAGASSTQRASFKSLAIAGPELQDKLLQKPVEEALAFGGKTLTGKPIPAADMAAHRGAFFNPSPFERGNSRAVLEELAPYAGALASKNAAVEEVAQSQANLTQKTGKSAEILASMAEGFKRSRGREKGIPQFDEEHFEHFTKLNPGNPEDRAKLAEAARMQMTKTPQELPQALQNLVATAQLGAPTARAGQTAATVPAKNIAAQPGQTTTAAPEQAAAAQTPARKGEEAQAAPSAQGSQTPPKPTEAAERGPMSRGSAMPRASSPEERQRRAEQAEFFGSRGLTSKSSDADMAKAHAEFAEIYARRMAAAKAEQTETNAPTHPRGPNRPQGMTR